MQLQNNKFQILYWQVPKGSGINKFRALLRSGFQWSFFSYHFAFVIQLAFTYMRAVTNMCFTGSAVSGQGNSGCFIVCPAFCASLLTMSAFRIWHISKFTLSKNLIQSSFLINENQLSRFLNLSNPFQIGLPAFSFSSFFSPASSSCRCSSFLSTSSAVLLQ